MAERTQLQIRILPDGKVEIKTQGLKGEACIVETRDLERTLGRVLSRTKTREYYEQPARSGTRTKTR